LEALTPELRTRRQKFVAGTLGDGVEAEALEELISDEDETVDELAGVDDALNDSLDAEEDSETVDELVPILDEGDATEGLAEDETTDDELATLDGASVEELAGVELGLEEEAACEDEETMEEELKGVDDAAGVVETEDDSAIEEATLDEGAGVDDADDDIMDEDEDALKHVPKPN
jgi:hypothetical protein